MRMTAARTISLVVAAVLCPVILFAEPVVTEQTKYYEIQGTTGRALKNQMRHLGPKSFWAYTEWHTRWSSRCEVKVEFTFTYPVLKGRSAIPKKLLRQWDQMMELLTIHENGHAEIVLQAARNIEAAQCVNAMKIFKKGNQASDQYDIDTRHGRNQGVGLPD